MHWAHALIFVSSQWWFTFTNMLDTYIIHMLDTYIIQAGLLCVWPSGMVQKTNFITCIIYYATGHSSH